MSDKISSLTQVMVGSLTVILAQLGAFYFGDASSDMNKSQDSENIENNVEKEADAGKAA